MNNINFAHTFLDALAIELKTNGYGVVDKDKIAKNGSVRHKRKHGPGVTGIIDVGPTGGYIWLDVNGVSYAVRTFHAPKPTGDSTRDAITIDCAVASIMTPLTWRSDLAELDFAAA